jgi:hypothetical protein
MPGVRPDLRSERVNRFLHLGLSLALGALTTLAIAWTAAAFGDTWRSLNETRGAWRDPGTGRWLLVSKVQKVAETRVFVWPIADAEVEGTQVTYPLPPRRRQRLTLPITAREPGRGIDTNLPDDSTRLRLTFGFPFRCVSGHVDETISGSFVTPTFHGLVNVYQEAPARPTEASLRRWGDFSIRLPVQPLAGGMIADTAIYAGAWSMIGALASVGRRRLRKRRGVCPACQYDRRGLPAGAPCPECGAGRSPGA